MRYAKGWQKYIPRGVSLELCLHWNGCGKALGSGVYMSVSVQWKAGKSHHVLGEEKGQSGTGALENDIGIGREEQI